MKKKKTEVYKFFKFSANVPQRFTKQYLQLTDTIIFFIRKGLLYTIYITVPVLSVEGKGFPIHAYTTQFHWDCYQETAATRQFHSYGDS